VGKFEALRRVQRRQAHGVRLALVLAFEHRDERDHLRELEEVLPVRLAFLDSQPMKSRTLRERASACFLSQVDSR
jgi:hypothetical protein